jgi:hypothetical protein
LQDEGYFLAAQRKQRERLNPRVERLNGTMRDREKVMRGMHSKESAQKVIEAIRINYNYCREHQALGGVTPAQAAGVKFDAPEGSIKIESLIRMAANNKQVNVG